ncbi:MAG: protein kinase [Planctomycetes bacterium]|nr:protein kinase [Planctomycetota bacterium]
MPGSAEEIRSAAELFDFVSAFLADRAAGRVLPLEEYAARFPTDPGAIEAEYARLCADDRASGAPLDSFGPYRIECELGRGGQGTVYLAEDTRLGRRVALKLLAPVFDFGTGERLHRFRREAEILSKLDHPGICTVFEADVLDNVPFLAMRFVEGATLASMLQAKRAAGDLPRSRDAVDEVLGWIESAARALHAAHEVGVVHRDIKPGNICITPDGSPVLLDFGLARREFQDASVVTNSGVVVGTLAYMAPELLGPVPENADRRSDVYGLGATLFECLTHALPFAAKSHASLWRAIEIGDLTDPRKHNPSLPRDLSAVVLTAIARDPARRYATAAELADDVARVRAREPVTARHAPWHERAIRTVRRHPTTSLGVAALVALFGVMAFALAELRAREHTARALYRSLHAVASDDAAATALADLVDATRDGVDASLRSAILQVLDGCHLAYRIDRTRPPPFVVDPTPVLDPRGQRFALGDSQGLVRIHDALSGSAIAERIVGSSRIAALTFAGPDTLWVLTSPGDLVALRSNDLVERCRLAAARPGHGLARSADGSTIAVGRTGLLSLCRATDGASIVDIELDADSEPRTLRYSPDGAHLLVLAHVDSDDPDAADRAYVVDVQAARVEHRLEGGGEGILCADWHGDGRNLALGFNGGRVEVRELDHFSIAFATRVGQEVHWCGFDPSGELLLVPCDDGTDLWRWRDAPERPDRRLPHAVCRTWGAAAFGADHRWLAAVHRDGTVAVLDTLTWRVVRTFRQRMVAVRFLCWVHDPGILLTADIDAVSAWHVGARPYGPELLGHAGPILDLDMDPSASRLASASGDRTARVWSIDRATSLAVLDHGGATVTRVHYAAAGTRLLTAADDGVARLWDATTGTLLEAFESHAGPLQDVLALPGDTAALTLGTDGAARVVDLASGRSVRTFGRIGAPIRSADLHPDRPWVALGGADRWLTVWDWTSGERVFERQLGDPIANWRTNPVHQIRGVRFDARTGRVDASLVNNILASCDLSGSTPDRLAVTDRFGGPLVRDPVSDALLCADFSFGRLTLVEDMQLTPLTSDGVQPHTNRISALAIAPGGGRGLSAGCDGQLWVWDLARREVVCGMRVDTAILSAQFSPDGRWIAAGTADGRIKLWPTDPITAAQDYLSVREAGPSRTGFR